MRTFSANDFLMLWERGRGLHAIDRALLILHCAMPEAEFGALVHLPLGERDRLLLQLYRDNFGDPIEAYAECPACAERLEFVQSCARLLAQTANSMPGRRRIEVAGAHLTLRCPDSADAAAMAAAGEVEAGIAVLLQRCVEAEGGAFELALAVRARIASELAAGDPAAEILLELRCAACAHHWSLVFDAGHFLWRQLRARARRLLQEVDALARCYHWNEAEILALSDARRALYLEMALS